MSVILINDLKGYARLLNGIQMFRLAEMEFIHRGTEFSEERAKQLFILHCLNVKSWNNRYKNNQAEQTYTEDEFVYQVMNNRLTAGEYKIVEQVYKSLQFLNYQIEDYELKLDYNETSAIKWLKVLISDCQDYLLRKHTQYDTMKWAI